MPLPRTRDLLVFISLFALWGVIAAWQTAEHRRAQAAARAALLNRAHDISNSLSVVMRSQGRFGMIPRQRLEAALQELAEWKELLSLALLNRQDQVVASAGESLRANPKEIPAGASWRSGRLTVANLVDLGPGVDTAGTATTPMVLIDAPPVPTSATLESRRRRFADFRGPRGFPPPPPGDRPTTALAAPGPPRGPGRGFPPFPPSWSGGARRPPWMTEKEFRACLEKQGLHKFVLVMSTAGTDLDVAQDLSLRRFLSALALLAAAGIGLAWWATARSGELQLRLLRAKELNVHLREMNVAAAGLAHETRNPLNLVRGLAQLISKNPDTPPSIHRETRQIVEEVDRVTSRLNEFINYSKPREPKPAHVSLRDVIGDVQRTLESDREDKSIQFSLSAPDLTVETDEGLFRQVLFNLLLNAYQAVHPGGHVEVTVTESGWGQAVLEVSDDGPGVPPEAREDIFRPYFSLNKQGTGLGLAVVRQIVLAHRWEIEYRAKESTTGATFRITGLKVARKTERP